MLFSFQVYSSLKYIFLLRMLGKLDKNSKINYVIVFMHHANQFSPMWTHAIQSLRPQNRFKLLVWYQKILGETKCGTFDYGSTWQAYQLVQRREGSRGEPRLELGVHVIGIMWNNFGYYIGYMFLIILEFLLNHLSHKSKYIYIYILLYFFYIRK